MDGYASVQVTPRDPFDFPFIIPPLALGQLFPADCWPPPASPSILSPPCCPPPSPRPPTSFPLTHHHGNVENVHLLLYNLRGLLECGGGGPGQLPRATHGDVEVQGAVLQPLLPPVHQRDVRRCARHLCKTRPKVLGELPAWPHVPGREEATPTQELRRYLLCTRMPVLTSNL